MTEKISLTSTTLSFTVAYLFILLGIGYASYRKTASTAEDYFMASRSFGTFVVAMTGFALMVPSFAAALYWRRTTGPGVVASLAVSGALMVVFFGTGWLSWLKMRFMPIVPLLIVNIIVWCQYRCGHGCPRMRG